MLCRSIIKLSVWFEWEKNYYQNLYEYTLIRWKHIHFTNKLFNFLFTSHCVVIRVLRVPRPLRCTGSARAQRSWLRRRESIDLNPTVEEEDLWIRAIYQKPLCCFEILSVREPKSPCEAWEMELLPLRAPPAPWKAGGGNEYSYWSQLLIS